MLNNPLRYIDPTGHWRIDYLGIVVEQVDLFTTRIALDRDTVAELGSIFLGLGFGGFVKWLTAKLAVKLGELVAENVAGAIAGILSWVTLKKPIELLMGDQHLEILMGPSVLWNTGRWYEAFLAKGAIAPEIFRDQDLLKRLPSGPIGGPRQTGPNDYPCISPAIPCGAYPGPGQ